MHNDVAMNLFYYVLIMLICNFIMGSMEWKQEQFPFDQSWLDDTLFLCWAISLVLQTREIALEKKNLCDLSRLIKHSLVLLIKYSFH